MTAPEDPPPLPPQAPAAAPPSPWAVPPPGYGPPPPGYGPPPGYPPQQYPAYGWAQPAHNPHSTNGLAIASMVCGIVGCFYGIPAIVAIVLGFVARSQIKARPQQGSGMALAGIILGFAWIVLGIVIIAGFALSTGTSSGDGGPFP